MSVMQEQEPVRSRRSFTGEFKRDAVALVIDEGRRVIDVARSLGVGEGTLGNYTYIATTGLVMPAGDPAWAQAAPVSAE